MQHGDAWMFVQVAAMQAQRLSVAFSNLGGILKMQGRLQDAIACYEHVALLQPSVPEVQVRHPLMHCCDTDTSLSLFA